MGLMTGQFCDSFTPIADGVTNVVKNYAYWLQKKYGTCCVVAPDFPGHVDSEIFEVMRYYSVPVPTRKPYRSGFPFLDAGVQKKLKSMQFDLVHAHSPFRTGKMALKLARCKGIPIVASFHSKYYDDFKDALKSDTVAKMLTKMVVEFYNNVDYVWTVNKSTVDTLREYGFKGNVEVVENGIDFIKLSDIEKNHRDIGNETETGTLKLLYVGQHVWHKNLKLLINSLRIFKDSGGKFLMTMVGEGNAMEDLQQLVNNLGMKDNVVFTGRINDRDKLKLIYSNADLLLFPSVYDTFSLVVREAASVGCPSIVIENSNAAENVIDGFNGYLAKNDEKAFAEVISASVKDREKLKTVGINAYNTLFQCWESVIDEVFERYLEIVNVYNKIRA
jgi:glycosyltransferase involved in cell wall biosynthesis